MVKLNEDLDHTKVFLDKIGVLGKVDYNQYISKLDKVLLHIEEARLQTNPMKSKWIIKEAIYLGYIRIPNK